MSKEEKIKIFDKSDDAIGTNVDETVDGGGMDQEDGGKLMRRAQQSTCLQKFRYYFQHPYYRIFISYFVIFCNFWIYAEDPVAHSRSKCEIPVVGNTFSFVATKYPPNAFSLLKVVLWITAIICGIIVGKLFFHHFLFKRILKLSMFSNDQGSWMICFLTSLVSLLIISFIYNGFLSLDSSMGPYKITGYIGTTNQIFMRVAALGTWFGDFITAWMVTDMMLQDTKKYPNWAVKARNWWVGYRRVILFWVFSIVLTIIVVVAITTKFINWDKLNRDMIYTNEIGRAFLASFILFMDFTIVMQDWDFPLFQTNLDVKLPGVNTAHIKFKIPSCLRRENWVVHVTGKWFNYGILFMVMILDLNMWKNQIFYKPLDFGQYTGEDGHIFSVYDQFSLDRYKNKTIYSYDWRFNTIDPLTNQSYYTADYRTNSRYRGYPLAYRALAFIPSIFVFIMFGTLVYIFGREGTAQYETVEFKKRGVSVTSIRVEKSKRDQVSPTEGSQEKTAPASPSYGATNKIDDNSNTVGEEKEKE